MALKKTYQTIQLISLPRQMKMAEEVTLTNLCLQGQQYIQKCEDTSFLHGVITKRLFQNFP